MKETINKKMNPKLINSIEVFEKKNTETQSQTKKTKPDTIRLKDIYQLSSDKIDKVKEASVNLSKEVESNPKRRQDFQELDAFFNEIKRIYS